MASRILESVPLGLTTPYRLLHASVSRDGYLDLGPESRLEVITPIGTPNPSMETQSVEGSGHSLMVTVKTSPEFIGIERAWYMVGFGGVVPIRAEAHIQGKVEQRTGPAANPFAGFAAAYYRLVYKSDESEVLLGASSRAALDGARADPCANASIRCLAIPRYIGVNPYLAVKVQDREVLVAYGGTLRSALAGAGKRPEEVAATLRIEKPFGGRMTPVLFDRTKADVFDLVLLGNEVIRF